MKVNASAKLIILITLLITTLPAAIYLTHTLLNSLKDDSRSINAIGYIRGSMQRLSKDYSHPQQALIIENVQQRFAFIESTFIKHHRLQDQSHLFMEELTRLKQVWSTLVLTLQNKGDPKILFTLSEECWRIADNATNAAEFLSTHAYDRLIATVILLGIFVFFLLILTLYFIQKEVKNHLESSVVIDSLTHLYNRFYFIEQINRAIKAFTRNAEPFSLIFVDIDHFKTVNDRYGHPVGDRVLKSFAHLLKKSLRAEDEGFRYGGEEFVILAKSTALEEAYLLAERLRKEVEAFDFELGHPLTISLGIAQYEQDQNYTTLLNHADQMLYEAKYLGRNCTCVYEVSTM